MIFLAVFASWLLLPYSLFWWNGSLLLSLLLLISLPLAAQYFIAHKSIFPPWFKPGVIAHRNTRAGETHRGAERHASAESEASANVERAFEAALEQDDEAGTLGVLVGAAVQYYEGRITNPLVDFKLKFKNIVIECEESWKLRRQTHPTKPSKSASPATYLLRGWYVPTVRKGRTIVLLVHGAGRDRRTFMRHIPVFHTAGYATFLLDCREHGLSSAHGKGVGFTTREALDVIQAGRFCRDVLGYEKVVVCGTSQGGASSIIAAALGEEIRPSYKASQNFEGSKSPPYVFDAVIAENPFVSREACIQEVLERLLGRIPAFLFPFQWFKSLFISGAVLMLRFRLGLFDITDVSSYVYQWMRVQKLTQPRNLKSKVTSALHRPVAPIFDSSRIYSPRMIAQATDAFDKGDHTPLMRLIADVNAIEVVDSISPRPLLLMHGLKDEIITPEHSEALYAAARDPKRMWMLENAHHTALINTDPQGWNDTVIGFLKQHGL